MSHNTLALLNGSGIVDTSGLPLSEPEKAKAYIGTPVLSDFVWICHNIPDDERRQFCAMSGTDEYDADQAAINCASNPGPKWVMLDEGKPLAIGGFTLLRRGVWQSFMLVPEASWLTHGRQIHRAVKKILKEMKNQGHRVQTLVLSDRAKARAWYDRIGLEHESTLRHYGANGENVEMYSIVQEQES